MILFPMHICQISWAWLLVFSLPLLRLFYGKDIQHILSLLSGAYISTYQSSLQQFMSLKYRAFIVERVCHSSWDGSLIYVYIEREGEAFSWFVYFSLFPVATWMLMAVVTPEATQSSLQSFPQPGELNDHMQQSPHRLPLQFPITAQWTS